MSFSRRRYPRALRQRGRTTRPDGSRTPAFRYQINWTCPTILISLIAVFFLFYLCQCAQLIGVQYRIGQLKEKKTALMTQQKELKVNIENLQSLERIEKIAVNELAMIYPEKRYMLTIRPQTANAHTAEDTLTTASVR